jgi:cytochrome c5
VNKVYLSTIAGVLMIQALASYARNPEEEASIVERIKPVGKVCVEGASCLEPSTQAPSAPKAVSPDSSTADVVENNVADTDVAVDSDADTIVAENYTKTCAICHAAGVAGAPKFGSSEEWQARIAKGKEVLYQSSINGLPPAMPAKGMCFACSDDDLKALVDYMVKNSQ